MCYPSHHASGARIAGLGGVLAAGRPQRSTRNHAPWGMRVYDHRPQYFGGRLSDRGAKGEMDSRIWVRVYPGAMSSEAASEIASRCLV